MSTSTGGSHTSSGSSPGEDINEAYRRRLAVFTALVAIIAAVGVWMALSSVREGARGVDLVTITAGVKPQPGDVTLMAALLPENSDGLGRRLMESSRVKELAREHELFLAETSTGRKALCVGLFESTDADGLEKLRRRFRDFTLNGKRVFPKARPRRIAP